MTDRKGPRGPQRAARRVLTVLAVLVSMATACSSPVSLANQASSEAAGGRAVASGTGMFNYGEALQKALFFYEENRSGFVAGPNNRVNWRGNAFTNDGADVGLDLSGGWHDAGDHIKFNLPMSYSAGTLLWSVYENAAAYKASGLYPTVLENIKWATDYLIKTHAAPNVIYYQVSNKAYDHNWWGSSEVFDPAKPRPTYKLDVSKPGSAVAGDMAATFAMGALVFKETNPAYAATLLAHAKDAYNFANATRSDAGYTAADGMYNSWSGFWDELLWASTWLNLATGEAKYLADAESFVPKLNRQGQSTDIEYQWAHCWDDKHYGAMILLARLTGKPEYKRFVEMHLDWWAAGAKGKTPGGLSWMSEWGSLRYASTAAFLALVYDKDLVDAAKKATYRGFAEKQINYILGANPQNFSYMIGFGSSYPLHPHHRDAHGSWSDQMSIPAYHRHTLVGAIVGGPASATDGSYTDSINDFQANEVATDYNAGLVGALSFLYSKFGGTPLTNFPVAETPDGPEFFNEASINNAGSTYTEIKILTNNRSSWPARYGKSLKYRYFFDISELTAAGYGIGDVTVSTNYTEFPVTRKVALLKGTVYYVEIAFVNDGDVVPRSQSAFAGEVQLRIAGPQGTSLWNPANDFSYQGLVAGSTTAALTQYIPVYEGNVLVFGKEPGPVVPDTTAPAIPSGLTSLSVGSTGAVLDWADNRESDLAGYEVTLARSSDLTSSPVVTQASSSTASLSGLMNNTLYYAAVKAVDTSGNKSARTAVISFTTTAPDLTPPAVPTGLLASAITASGATLTWIANTETDLAGYDLWQGSVPDFTTATGAKIGTVTVANRSVTGLAADTQYYFRVQAKDNSGNLSTLSATLAVKTAKAPAATVSVSFVSSSPSASTNTLGGRLVIKNGGTTAVALSNLKVAYFLSNEGGKGLNFWCDHAGGSVNGNYTSFTASVNAALSSVVSVNASDKVSIGFTSTAPTLGPGDTVEVQFRVTTADWSNFNPTNDWSYSDPTHLVVYNGGVVISGVEP